MEWIDDFKRNLDNPYNIKGFSELLNPDFLEEAVDIKKVEAEIFNERYDTKIDVDKIISEITRGQDISTTPTPNTITPSFNDFIGFDSAVPDTSYLEDDIKKQLDDIYKQRRKNRVKELLKEIKLEDNDFDTEAYFRIINNPNISDQALKQVIELLEGELSCYEGKSSVTDGILMITGFLEGYFDGSNIICGSKPNLDGLSDSMEVTLRKRKFETTNIHRDVKETLGFGSYAQLAFDIATNTVTTAQKNNRGTSSTKRAIKLKKNIS